MVKRKQKNIDAGIPWYKDLRFIYREITIGKTCVRCNELIDNFHSASLYHEKCFTKKCSETAREKARMNRKTVWKPKYCIVCNELLPETKWKCKTAVRCDYHQMLYTKERMKNYINPKSKEIKYSICSTCGIRFETSHRNIIKCDTHRYRRHKRKLDSDIVETAEKYNIGKEYMKKNGGKINKNKRLGTYDTSPSHIGNVEHKKNNHIDERNAVSKLKRETFKKSKYKNNYTANEGDWLRGDMNEYKNKYGNGE